MHLVLALLALTPTADPTPTVADPRYTLELVAEHPQIVTPTGLAVDAKGRVWVVENNTHQRPPTYKGHPSDRILIFDDFGPDGRARKRTEFADGFKDAMSLAIAPDGQMWLATRSTIYRFKDDRKTVVVRLETKGNYPHNGLCGFAFAPTGEVVFGLGENLGEPYKLIASDDAALTGGGEGGNVYRIRPDGTGLARIATGFWNPYGLAYDPAGRLFCVDNDPDARGPCRLLHVVEGGDFGYRFRYGRKGLHPFTAWNGEIPGTLPMVAGTSEAPSAVLAEPTGDLLITSWGDHTIERFTLTPRGASVGATAKVVVRGNENFRPVAFAPAPDGSIVFTDWVDKSYPVHGKGRVWRLRPKTPIGVPRIVGCPIPSPKRDAASDFLTSDDPFEVSIALHVLGRREHIEYLSRQLPKADPKKRLGLLLALRRADESDPTKSLNDFLRDDDPGVRRAAIQWAAEAKRKDLVALVKESGQKPPVTRELLEAMLAGTDLLTERGSKNEVKTEQIVALVAGNSTPTVKAMALRMLPPDHPSLTAELLAKLIEDAPPDLEREVARTLMTRPDDPAQKLLLRIAGEAQRPLDVRALAVAGLAHSAQSPATKKRLAKARSVEGLSDDAERSLRGPLQANKRSVAEWRDLLKTDGNPASGERVFYHVHGAGCYRCHRIDARGGNAGPDLTFVGRSLTRERLIASILEPSKEIAPMYTTWKIVTRDGRDRVGIVVEETFDSNVIVADQQGKIEKLKRTEIEERTALPTSLMPDHLADTMTPQECRDLIAFLMLRR